jgi:hypothetical protein
LRAVRSVFSVEKELSIAALSKTLPDRLIEQVTPSSAHQPLELVRLTPEGSPSRRSRMNSRR